MFFLFLKKNKYTRKQEGFSLIELMVTISIVLLATSAVLAQYTSFNSATLLKSQALEVSLDIRTAQSYGVNVKATGGGDRFAYGIYFNPATPQQYVLFNDTNDNLLYDAGEEIGNTYTLDERFFLKEVCVSVSSVRNCSAARAASVAFKRPNFDAIIANTDGSGFGYALQGETWVEFVFAPRNKPSVTRSVIVYQSGQIAVE